MRTAILCILMMLAISFGVKAQCDIPIPKLAAKTIDSLKQQGATNLMYCCETQMGIRTLTYSTSDGGGGQEEYMSADTVQRLFWKQDEKYFYLDDYGLTRQRKDFQQELPADNPLAFYLKYKKEIDHADLFYADNIQSQQEKIHTIPIRLNGTPTMTFGL